MGLHHKESNHHGTVTFDHPELFAVDVVKKKLEGLGYPEKGTLSGMKKLGANAISYVSCAIGKMTTETEK